MPARILAGAMCVQRFDDSQNSAIHTTYRISLRSSSMPEPRDPLLKVLIHFFKSSDFSIFKNRDRLQQRLTYVLPKQTIQNSQGWELRVKNSQNSIMILPQVHLLK